MNPESLIKLIETTVAGVALQAVGAVLLYIVGRWLISFAIGLVQKGLARQKIEPTLLRFIGNTISVVLNITLVIAILGYFGVQTTSFAALLAGAGLAIGSAWGGLLANFAAGVFLVVLRPFKVGDFISVGNNKLFSDNIQNFSTNPYRRVELSAQISGEADPKQVMAALKLRIVQIPNVIAKPSPEVVIASFTAVGPVLAIRPYTSNDHYWQVYFDTNLAIREVLGDGTFPAPMPVLGIHQVPPTPATKSAGA
jgi:small conductance mechanosensitive channel